ncbi:hypothetical protein [Caminibacter sp.]
MLKSKTELNEEALIAKIKSFFVRGFFKKIKGVRNLAIGIIEKMIPISAGEKKFEKYFGKKIT